jgi:hypothetical protein
MAIAVGTPAVALETRAAIVAETRLTATAETRLTTAAETLSAIEVEIPATTVAHTRRVIAEARATTELPGARYL